MFPLSLIPSVPDVLLLFLFPNSSTRSSQVLLCKTETKHDCPEKTAHPQYDTGRRKVIVVIITIITIIIIIIIIIIIMIIIIKGNVYKTNL